jgi:P4 family phage/plasmid primase-like protien
MNAISEQTNTAGATDGGVDPKKLNGTAATVEKLKRDIDQKLADDSAPDDDGPNLETAKVEIDRLAQLEPFEYEYEKRSAAKRLGLPLNVLDRLVTLQAPASRRLLSGNTDKLQTSLEMMDTSLCMWLSDHNEHLAFSGGCWWICREGHWRVIDRYFREKLDNALMQMCPGVGLIWARDGQMIERHLRASSSFKIDHTAIDRKPYVAVRNGTVNLDTGVRMEHSPDHLITRFIDIEYDPAARCPEWVAMLMRALDDYSEDDRAKIARFLQEWIGVGLFGGSNERTPRALRKILFLYGLPNSGKSTILDVVRAMLGTDRIVAHTPTEVTHRFGLQAFLTAAAWITDEVDDSHALGSSKLKPLVTGEPVNVQIKGEKDVTLRFHGPIAWAGNTKPNFREASGAIYDRIVVLPLNRTFDPAESRKIFGNIRPIEWLRDRGELPGIFNWALIGYKRLLERGMFEDIAALRAERDQWRENNDPAYDFIKNYTEPAPGIRNTAEVLAVAAMGYVKANRSDRWPKLQTLKEGINTAVAELHPSAMSKVATKRKIVVYDNLALTDDGLKYFDQGIRDNEALRDGLKLTPNQELTLRGG